MLTVSIITPTWQRHDFLIDRCIPSVQAQDYPFVEHVIVSDGPDPALGRKLSSLRYDKHPIRYYELPDRDPVMYRTRARRYGIGCAVGTYIGYNDDDDALRPEHCRMHAEKLDENPEAGWSKSLMISHSPSSENAIGWGDPACGNIGTPMVVHRRTMLDVANWGVPGAYEDWELFDQWIESGIPYIQFDHYTVDVYPSVYRS